MTEQMDLYLGVVMTLMFLFGCFLTVLSIRQRSEERRRWLGSTMPGSGRTQKRSFYQNSFVLPPKTAGLPRISTPNGGREHSSGGTDK